MNVLLFLFGCGGVCPNGAVEVIPAPWDAIDWQRSETADVCRASAEEIQYLQTDGTVSAQLTAIEAALTAAGWWHEERAKNETTVDGVEIRSWRTDDVLAEVSVNRSFDGKWLVTTLRDNSDALKGLWSKPSDFDEVIAAAASASTDAWSAVQGRKSVRSATSCPDGTTVGPIVDLDHLAVLQGKPKMNDAPDFSGPELTLMGTYEAGSDYAMDAQYRYSKAHADNGTVVIQVTSYTAPSLGQGDVFMGGSVKGDVWVVNGDQVVCATTFAAENSETVKSGEQWKDLHTNATAAIDAAVRAIR